MSEGRETDMKINVVEPDDKRLKYSGSFGVAVPSAVFTELLIQMTSD